MPEKHLIVVLGSGRSGTSAVTRVLSLGGCALPESIFGARDENPTGFWEPVVATKLNVEFLSRLGLLSDPTMRLDELEIDPTEREAFIEQISLFLNQCPKRSLLIIKETRINELMEFWLDAALRTGYSVKVVIVVRHPEEVYQSKSRLYAPKNGEAARESAPSRETFSAYWLKTNLLADRHSRGLQRVFVNYENLMRDWRVEVDRISNALSIDLKADNDAVDAFLRKDLHHRKYCGPMIEAFGNTWTSRVYEILSSAALDRPINLSELDEICSAYQTAARAFRIVMEETRSELGVRALHEHMQRMPVWKFGRDYS